LHVPKQYRSFFVPAVVCVLVIKCIRSVHRKHNATDAVLTSMLLVLDSYILHCSGWRQL
jgi:hypothetical protein